MNTGKVFESNFKKSIPKDIYFQRIKDPAVGFTGGAAKFAPNNPYDFFLFDGYLHCIELKSKLGAITFWREDLEHDGAKHSFEIKKCQIKGLQEAASHENVYAGIIVNFRDAGRTVYIPIASFISFSEHTNKKSMNVQDALAMGIEVSVKKLKVNERYGIADLLKEVERSG